MSISDANSRYCIEEVEIGGEDVVVAAQIQPAWCGCAACRSQQGPVIDADAAAKGFAVCSDLR